MASAQFSTPALTTANQVERERRILEAATARLAARGEDGLQMKEIAVKADVSIATLYRYFPSKDKLLLAICVARYESALAELDPERLRGDTPGRRVGDLLLREFAAQQREPMLTAALQRVASLSDRAYSDLLDRMYQVHLDMLNVTARGGGDELSPAQVELLPLINHVFSGATRAWIAGTQSAAESRNQITAAAALLDSELDLAG